MQRKSFESDIYETIPSPNTIADTKSKYVCESTCDNVRSIVSYSVRICSTTVESIYIYRYNEGFN